MFLESWSVEVTLYYWHILIQGYFRQPALCIKTKLQPSWNWGGVSVIEWCHIIQDTLGRFSPGVQEIYNLMMGVCKKKKRYSVVSALWNRICVGRWSGATLHSNAEFCTPRSGCPETSEFHVQQPLLCRPCSSIQNYWLNQNGYSQLLEKIATGRISITGRSHEE